jgi:glycosyltransferase involved in cell wall biosynthesis
MKYYKFSYINFLTSKLELFHVIFFSNCIIACNADLANFWSSKGYKKRIYIIKNFVENNVNINKFSKTSKKIHLFLIGRIEQRKGSDIAIQIISELFKLNDNIYAHFLVQNLEIFQAKLFLSQYSEILNDTSNNLRIKFKSFSSKKNLLKYLITRKGKKIYLHPARYEPNSLAILEAMSLGMPIFTSYEAGKELNIEKKCGSLCRNKDEYVTKIYELISNNHKFISYSWGSLENQRKKFDFNYAYREIMGVYSFLSRELEK